MLQRFFVVLICARSPRSSAPFFALLDPSLSIEERCFTLTWNTEKILLFNRPRPIWAEKRFDSPAKTAESDSVRRCCISLLRADTMAAMKTDVAGKKYPVEKYPAEKKPRNPNRRRKYAKRPGAKRTKSRVTVIRSNACPKCGSLLHKRSTKFKCPKHKLYKLWGPWILRVC